MAQLRELDPATELDQPAGELRELPADVQLDAPAGTDPSQITGPDITSENVDYRPPTLEEFTKGLVSRGAMTAAGGMAGFAAGGGAALLAGPGAPLAAAGTAGVGSALGTMAGSVVYDNVENFMRATGLLRGGPQAGPMQVIEEALGQGAVDIGISALSPYVAPIQWAKRAAGKLLGVTGADAVNTRKIAESFGIELGAVDVGNVIAKGYAKVIGVFPWIGGQLRAEHAKKLGQAEDAVYSILDRLAPNATMLTDLGIAMTRAAEGTKGEFDKVSARLYDGFRELASKEGAVIPSGETRALASELKELAKQGEIVAGGKPLESPAPKEVQEYIDRLAALPEKLTYQQYIRLKDDLGDLIARGATDGFDVKKIVQVKRALEQDLQLIEGSPETLAALQTANKFYSKGIALFQTPTAGQMERVDKNIFQAGAKESGSLNPDEIAAVTVRLKSPQGLQDLRKLVGDDMMNQAARVRLQNAYDIASKPYEMLGMRVPVRVIRADALEKELGLAGRKSQAEMAGLEELLRTTGVTVGELKNFTTALRSIENMNSPAQFVMRRVILSGVAGGTGAMAFGVFESPGGGIDAGGLVLAILARKGASALANPVTLKNMTTAIGENVTASARKAAVVRLLEGAREQ